MANENGRDAPEMCFDEITGTGGVPVRSWTRGVPFEDAAQRQLMNIARLPFVHSHVAAMPDVHLGIGATVGSVIPTLGAIVPAAVGVDIGCGMLAQRTSLSAEQLPDQLKALRTEIEQAVPHGGGKGGRIGTSRNAMRRSRAATTRWPTGVRWSSWAHWGAATTSSKCAWTRPTGSG
jgi:tRNA-splicing ligase RtcB